MVTVWFAVKVAAGVSSGVAHYGGSRDPEMRGSLRRTFGLLEPTHQLVVRLHLEEALPFEEVAIMMDRSVEAVKKLWCRALRHWSKEAEDLQRQELAQARRGPLRIPPLDEAAYFGT